MKSCNLVKLAKELIKVGKENISQESGPVTRPKMLMAVKAFATVNFSPDLDPKERRAMPKVKTGANLDGVFPTQLLAKKKIPAPIDFDRECRYLANS